MYETVNWEDMNFRMSFNNNLIKTKKFDNKNQNKTIDYNSPIFSDTKFKIARVRKIGRNYPPKM